MLSISDLGDCVGVDRGVSSGGKKPGAGALGGNSFQGGGIAARSRVRGYRLEDYIIFAKGLITVLEIPLHLYLVVRYAAGTTLASPTDWFNLLGPSILALFIIVMASTKV